MELKERMRLSKLDELMEKEGFSRKENLWFANTIDLYRIVGKIAYGIPFNEVRILSTIYLDDKDESKIFTDKKRKKFDRYLIYVRE